MIRKLVLSFLLIFIVSCGGRAVSQSSLFIKIDSKLGNCMQQPCGQNLELFESKELTWEVNIPRLGEDLDEDPNVGRYILNGSEYELAIFGEEVNFTSDSSNIYVTVRNCAESLCPFKDDVVLIFVEKNDITYTILFYGTEDAQLETDGIPSADLLAKMPVSLEIYFEDFSDYLKNEGAVTYTYIFNN